MLCKSDNLGGWLRQNCFLSTDGGMCYQFTQLFRTGLSVIERIIKETALMLAWVI